MKDKIGVITVLCTIIGALSTGGAIGAIVGGAVGFLLENQVDTH